MRLRWLAVLVVVLLVMGSALLRSHPSGATVFGDVAARTHAVPAADALPPSAVALHSLRDDAAPATAAGSDATTLATQRAGPDALPTNATPVSSVARVAASGPEALRGPTARRTASAHAPSLSTDAPDAALVPAATANATAGTAAGGVAASGLQARPTIVRSTAGTATIYNAQIEVGFVFDPADNPNHRLLFNGPEVAKSEFTLHGDDVADVTVDGQQAVAGHWYPLHAGLILTAVGPVAVHVRPAPPKTDG